jgi:hypothetical protein
MDPQPHVWCPLLAAALMLAQAASSTVVAVASAGGRYLPPLVDQQGIVRRMKKICGTHERANFLE